MGGPRFVVVKMANVRLGLSAALCVQVIQSGLYGTSLKRASSQKRVPKCSSRQFSSMYTVTVRQTAHGVCIVMKVAARLWPSLFSNVFL